MLQIGRQGQLYAVTESTFGTTPTVASADALRHRTFKMSFDNKNRVAIAEKRQSPWHSITNRADRRKTADFNLDAVLHPSGTLNTLPEADEIFTAVFGAKQNITLSTTVSVGTGLVGGATVASTTGLLVGQGILITCPDGKKRVRRIVTLPGANAVTWTPNLPAGQNPADGAAVKGVLTYRLTAFNTASLSFCHYLKKTDGTAGLSRVIAGAVADKFSLKFDANDEPTFSVSGPGKSGGDPPAQPGAFTTVGSQPPSGILGELYIGNTQMKFLKLGLDISNAMFVRNESYGYDSAEEAFRGGYGEIMMGIDCRAEDEATLYDLTEAGTRVAAFKQTGFAEGSIISLAAPNVEFKVPDTDDPDDGVNWGYKGPCLETTEGALDGAFLYLA